MVNEPVVQAISFVFVPLDLALINYPKVQSLNFVFTPLDLASINYPKVQGLNFTLVPPTTLKSASINSQTSLL
jgi:hypothetical protein